MTLLENTDRFRFEIVAGAALPGAALMVITAIHFGWWRGVLATALLVVSLLLHECGHAAAAWLTGTPFSAIGFCAKGAYIRRKRAKGVRGEIFIAATGPAVNFILAIAVWHAGHLVQWLALMNLLIGATNLIPLKGSDGARIYTCFRELWSPQTLLTTPESDPAQSG